MSQPAMRRAQINVGSTARALPLAAPEPISPEAGAQKKARTPLALVTSTPKRSSSQLIVILFMVVLVAMSVVLVMSISVSKGQYELVDLKGRQTTLMKSNQALEQEIAAKQAPQKLVVDAAALGMVPAGTTGQIDVRSQTVSGAPQPAPADAKGLVVIPPAMVEKPKAPAEKAPGPQSPAAQEAAKDSGAPAAKPEANPAPAPAPVVDPGPVLNGGSIPAPAQKDG